MHALTDIPTAYQPPATERAALAFLARLQDHDARLRAILRIARTLQAEDRERGRRRWAGGTPVRIAGDPNAFETLTSDAKRRLIVRVLCELVAYGEEVDAPTPARVRLAANAP